MTNLKWKIYYGDGSTFDHTQGKAWEAPATDAQVIWQQQPEGVLIYGSQSAGRSDLGWFTYRDDWGWDIHDMPGFMDYLMHYKGAKAVLIGRTIPTDAFQEILKCAIKDKTNG